MHPLSNLALRAVLVGARVDWIGRPWGQGLPRAIGDTCGRLPVTALPARWGGGPSGTVTGFKKDEDPVRERWLLRVLGARTTPAHPRAAAGRSRTGTAARWTPRPPAQRD